MKDSIYVDLGFENMMSFIYGEGGHSALAGHTSIASWKKLLLQLIGTIAKAIEKNVNGDESYRRRLIEHCEISADSIKRSKTKDDINQTAIRFAFSMVFRLLGRMPHNWRSRRAHHSKVTTLSQHRLLNYVRTDEMKAREILDYAFENRLGSGSPSFQDLITAYNYRFHKNPTKFLNWVCIEFPTVYEQFN